MWLLKLKWIHMNLNGCGQVAQLVSCSNMLSLQVRSEHIQESTNERVEKENNKSLPKIDK